MNANARFYILPLRVWCLSSFVLQVHPARDEAGMLALTFEHPTMPGPQPGGWMVKNEAPVIAPAPKVCFFLGVFLLAEQDDVI